MTSQRKYEILQRLAAERAEREAGRLRPLNALGADQLMASARAAMVLARAAYHLASEPARDKAAAL